MTFYFLITVSVVITATILLIKNIIQSFLDQEYEYKTKLSYLFDNSDFEKGPLENTSSTQITKINSSPYRSAAPKPDLILDKKIYCSCGQEIKIAAKIKQ
jgi:hypothetical protein